MLHGPLRTARVVALLSAALLAACEGIELPFLPTPTPEPTPAPRATPPPTPTPIPRAAIEVKRIVFAVVDPRTLAVAAAFSLRNPNTDEFVLAANASGALTTPGGRVLPQAKPAITFDLAPGEEKWFAFPSIDTFASVVGKVEVAVSGGQWVPASAYPYPGGVPLSVALSPAQKSGATAAADFIVKNSGELGANAQIRGFAFDASAKFLGLVECPARLYPAQSETTVGCGAPSPAVLRATRIDFAAYPDLRPVLVIPTPAPSPSPTAAPRPVPSPSPTGR